MSAVARISRLPPVVGRRRDGELSGEREAAGALSMCDVPNTVSL